MALSSYQEVCVEFSDEDIAYSIQSVETCLENVLGFLNHKEYMDNLTNHDLVGLVDALRELNKVVVDEGKVRKITHFTKNEDPH